MRLCSVASASRSGRTWTTGEMLGSSSIGATLCHLKQPGVDANTPPRDVNLPHGPVAWQNWRALHQELPRTGAREFVLYSDAWLVGGPVFQLGPFGIINTIPARIPAEMAPALVLRVDNY